VLSEYFEQNFPIFTKNPSPFQNFILDFSFYREHKVSQFLLGGSKSNCSHGRRKASYACKTTYEDKSNDTH
jgi:hypothetical protein